jgi:hypothetical protein
LQEHFHVCCNLVVRFSFNFKHDTFNIP